MQETFLQAWKSYPPVRRGNQLPRLDVQDLCFTASAISGESWFRFPLLKQKEEFLEANLPAREVIPDKLTDAEILAALDRISDDYRSVVLLVDIEGVRL